jgi:hypothetical protein
MCKRVSCYWLSGSRRCKIHVTLIFKVSCTKRLINIGTFSSNDIASHLGRSESTDSSYSRKVNFNTNSNTSHIVGFSKILFEHASFLWSKTTCFQYTRECYKNICFNPLTPNDLQRRRVVSPLRMEIPNKNMREKPTKTPIIRSV